MGVKGFKNSIAWYDHNAEKYAKLSENRELFDQINEFLKLLPKKARILDAGCGSGFYAYFFFKLGYHVSAIDLSKNLISYSLNKYKGINFQLKDFRKTGFLNGYFDGIWAHASLVHLETLKDAEKSIVEFNRVLKKDGILHILVKAQKRRKKTEVIYDSLTKSKRFFRYFNKQEILKILTKNNFKILDFSQYNEYAKYPRLPGARKDVDWILVLAKKF